MDGYKMRKSISLILKAVTVISAAVGTILSAAGAAGTFMGGKVVLMYFTIQSNIGIALICAIGAWLLTRGGRIPDVWYLIKLVGTVAITLTGIVFCFVLAPVLGDKAWNVQNTLTHVVVPVAAVADMFVTGARGRISKRSVLWVTLPPIVYAVYAGIGYVMGWEFSRGKNYPYFFLDWGSDAGALGFTDTLPYMGCVWWILAILIFLLAVGYLYRFIIEKIGISYDDRG
ncbi:MAG: Pr6Pr family membrane protein [Oscillospiraceae bacterium]|nr:Pr6Pr family membrane protein [Oscillospiraceae bacterium]